MRISVEARREYDNHTYAEIQGFGNLSEWALDSGASRDLLHSTRYFGRWKEPFMVPDWEEEDSYNKRKYG